MAKIERKYLAHFINAAQLSAEAPAYERLGKDLEEYSPELSAQVDVKRNILGQTSVLVSGYEKTGAVETYYAEAGSALFKRLQDMCIFTDTPGVVIEAEYNTDTTKYMNEKLSKLQAAILSQGGNV